MVFEDILPKNTFFKGFEVSHSFPFIGHKVIILNAREIHYKKDNGSGSFPPIILLAMEDVTEMMAIAEKLADHSNHFEERIAEKTQQIESHISNLEKEVNKLKIEASK